MCAEDVSRTPQSTLYLSYGENVRHRAYMVPVVKEMKSKRYFPFNRTAFSIYGATTTCIPILWGVSAVDAAHYNCRIGVRGR